MHQTTLDTPLIQKNTNIAISNFFQSNKVDLGIRGNNIKAFIADLIAEKIGTFTPRSIFYRIISIPIFAIGITKFLGLVTPESYYPQGVSFGTNAIFCATSYLSTTFIEASKELEKSCSKLRVLRTDLENKLAGLSNFIPQEYISKIGDIVVKSFDNAMNNRQDFNSFEQLSSNQVLECSYNMLSAINGFIYGIIQTKMNAEDKEKLIKKVLNNIHIDFGKSISSALDAPKVFDNILNLQAASHMHMNTISVESFELLIAKKVLNELPKNPQKIQSNVFAGDSSPEVRRKKQEKALSEKKNKKKIPPNDDVVLFPIERSESSSSLVGDADDSISEEKKQKKMKNKTVLEDLKASSGSEASMATSDSEGDKDNDRPVVSFSQISNDLNKSNNEQLKFLGSLLIEGENSGKKNVLLPFLKLMSCVGASVAIFNPTTSLSGIMPVYQFLASTLALVFSYSFYMGHEAVKATIDKDSETYNRLKTTVNNLIIKDYIYVKDDSDNLNEIGLSHYSANKALKSVHRIINSTWSKINAQEAGDNNAVKISPEQIDEKSKNKIYSMLYTSLGNFLLDARDYNKNFEFSNEDIDLSVQLGFAISRALYKKSDSCVGEQYAVNMHAINETALTNVISANVGGVRMSAHSSNITVNPSQNYFTGLIENSMGGANRRV